MSIAEAARKVSKVVRIAREPSWRAALIHQRTAAAIEHKQVLSGLFVNTVIDVGANRGQFSLLARALYPNAEIHCFEPLPEALTTLNEVFAADEKLRVHPIALSNSRRRSVIHVTKDQDSSSLLAPLPSQSAHFPGTEQSGELTVETMRLDEYLGPRLEEPVLLKLDVQGHEAAVLEGAAALLPQIDFVYAEVSFEALYRGQASASEVIRHLHTHGFELSGIGSTQRSHTAGRIVQADLLFSRRVIGRH